MEIKDDSDVFGMLIPLPLDIGDERETHFNYNCNFSTPHRTERDQYTLELIEGIYVLQNYCIRITGGFNLTTFFV